MTKLIYPPLHDEPRFDISVLIPTRGRKEPLYESVRSLLDNADNPTKILFMFGFDNDDRESLDYFANTIAPCLVENKCDYICYEFQRLGYMRLNEYVNHLAKWSDSKWLFFFNDDSLMNTKGWDSRIMDHDGEFKVLAVHTNNNHPYSVFPIIPKSWVNATGHFSPHTFSDAWVSEIAYMLGIMEFIDVEVLHDRADITGNNEDTTYRERNMPPADPSNPTDINNIEWVKRRYLEADRLAWFMKEKGLDINYWLDVRLGKRDPWVKLKENDPNNQVNINPVTE
jgi:hypothetical protein